ncbi:hypothetical protein [Cystobacter fuscus]|uniref:hypothetical protein n=1 Tax=Cystobacter fuscus TaxID=43 RepID=UPI0037C0D318
MKELYARTSIDPLAYALSEYMTTRLAQGLQLFKKPEMPRGGPSSRPSCAHGRCSRHDRAPPTTRRHPHPGGP